MKRELIDFFYVAPSHQAIHKRLENWARNCYSGGGTSASPMFRLYRSSDARRESPSIPTDYADADKFAKGVATLPESTRMALHWNYITGGSVLKARQRIGCSPEGLMSLISDGRQKLVDAGV